MNSFLLAILAFIAGAAISVQASLNAQLGRLLDSALLATAMAFISGLIFTLPTLLIFKVHTIPFETLRGIPFYLYFAGGLLSSFALVTFYWIIPKMGIGPMFSYALTGQLLFAVLAGHFGWLQLPLNPLSLIKVIGIFSLILGIVLINNG